MNIDGKRVVVTGGAGAIGYNLVRSLLGRGAFVTVIDDLSSGYLDNLPIAPCLEFIFGSITDETALEKCFEKDIDVVFHLAASFANANSVDYPQKDYETNCMGTLMVLEWAFRSGVSRFVYSSSSCVYGGGEGVKSEDEAVESFCTPYAVSKYSGERLMRFFAERFGLCMVILRYFNCYGEGERPGKYRNVIPNFFQRAINGDKLLITGDGSETRDFTYVGDIVEGTIAACKCDAARGEVFNLGCGREVSILTLAEIINDIAENSAGIECVNPRSWDGVGRRCANISKSKRVLGYEPQVKLNDGLIRTYYWLKERMSSYEGFAVACKGLG